MQRELRPVQTACGSCTCCSEARLGAAGGRAGGAGGGRAHHGPVGPVGSTGQRKEPESFSAPRRLRAEEADDRPYVFIGRTDEEACLRPHTRRGAKGRPRGSPWDGSALIAAQVGQSPFPFSAAGSSAEYRSRYRGPVDRSVLSRARGASLKRPL